jgi:hypothetical protein
LAVKYKPGAAFLVCTIVWREVDELYLEEAGYVANMGFEMEIGLVEHLLAIAEHAERIGDSMIDGLCHLVIVT